MDVVDYDLHQQVELLGREESHFFDIKRADISPSKLQETFVAMANSDGGEIIIGIDNDESLDAKSRVHAFRNPEAANNYVSIPEHLIDPPLLGVAFTFIRLPAKRGQLLLHAIVPKSDKVHYTSSKQCFKRRGAQNLSIKGPDIESLIFLKGQKSFEDVFVSSVTLGDLCESEYLEQYLDLVPTAQPAEAFLRKQRLVESNPSGKRSAADRIMCAAVLLFDDEPQSALSTRCGIKVTRYRTDTSKYKRGILADDPASIEGPTELLIKRAVLQVSKVMNSAYFKVKGRYKRLRYPETAIHEIVANAVLHRDYSLKDDVHIGIYDNRIEVTSPGRLPGHITPENILTERYMRNPKLVRLVNKLPEPPNKDIGEGLNTAFREMQQAQLRNPVIEETEAAVKVTLLHEPIASPEQQIVEYLCNNGCIQNRTARELTGKESEQSIFKIFSRLFSAGIIEPVDPDTSAFAREYQLASDWEANWDERFPGVRPKS